MDFTTYLKHYPDKDGKFGKYGGAILPPELIPAFEEINEAYQTICKSSQFINELRRIRREFQGRPTPVYHCERLSGKIGSCQIYLKREDQMCIRDRRSTRRSGRSGGRARLGHSRPHDSCRRREPPSAAP